uniref:Ankyrin repeat domain 9 n=1 Tax=Sus scrofa TaxID=9823 RepID=A0A287AXZ1_PIG
MPWDAQRPGGGADGGAEGAGAARSRAQKQCRKSSFAFYQAVRDLLPVWLLEDMRASEAFHWDERGRAAAYSPSEALLYALVHDHQAYAHYLLATFPRRALAPPSAGFRCCAAPGPHVALAVRYNRVGILRRILRTVRDFPAEERARLLDRRAAAAWRVAARRCTWPASWRAPSASSCCSATVPRLACATAAASRRWNCSCASWAATPGPRSLPPPTPPPGRLHPGSRASAACCCSTCWRCTRPQTPLARPAASCWATGRAGSGCWGRTSSSGWRPGATLALRACHAGAGHRHLARPLPRGPGRAAAATLPAAAGPHWQGLDRGGILALAFWRILFFRALYPALYIHCLCTRNHSFVCRVL